MVRMIYIALLSMVALVSGCSNYQDCYREVIQGGYSGDDRDGLINICIHEHEKELSESELRKLTSKALLAPYYESDNLYVFNVSTKNNTSNLMITEISWVVVIEDGEYELTHNFKSRSTIDPGKDRRNTFKGSSDLIKFDGVLDDNWYFYANSAKGVSLK